MKLAFQTAQPRLEGQSISTHPDFDRGPRKAAMILLGTTAVFFVLLFAWMSFAPLDISVNAVGAVVPSSRLQQIQSMEGGILHALNVHEGAKVKKGDVLAIVQNLQFNAEQGEAQQGYWAAQAASIRLDAEARNITPQFPADLEKDAPDLVREQRNLWQSRRQERENTLETLSRQLAQRHDDGFAPAGAAGEINAQQQGWCAGGHAATPAPGPSRPALCTPRRTAGPAGRPRPAGGRR